MCLRWSALLPIAPFRQTNTLRATTCGCAAARAVLLRCCTAMCSVPNRAPCVFLGRYGSAPLIEQQHRPCCCSPAAPRRCCSMQTGLCVVGYAEEERGRESGVHRGMGPLLAREDCLLKASFHSPHISFSPFIAHTSQRTAVS